MRTRLIPYRDSKYVSHLFRRLNPLPDPPPEEPADDPFGVVGGYYAYRSTREILTDLQRLYLRFP